MLSVVLFPGAVLLLFAAGGCGKGDSARGPSAADKGPKRMSCKEHKAQISKRALAAAACKHDTDCRIESLPVCSMKNIGCHFAALNPQRAKPLHTAVIAYVSASCKLTKCECPKRPKRARCQAGRCVPIPP